MPKILPMFSENLVNYVVNYLEERGVEFKIGTPIVACNEKVSKLKQMIKNNNLKPILQCGLLEFAVVNLWKNHSKV